MLKRLLLVLNPYAGQRKANRFLPEIIRLYNERGFECVTYITGGVGDATAYVAEHGHSFDHIVCIGGDGTLNETITGLVQSGLHCPVGYIPAGTTNDYASSIGLSGDVLQAAADAVDGTHRQFDLGSFNGRHFIYTASCGAFTRASYSTPQSAKNILGHLAYVLEGLRDLPTIKPIRMRVDWEGGSLEDDYLFCSITNSISVGGILKLDRNLVRLNDGLFEVMLIKNPTQPIQWTKLLMSLRSSDMPSEMIEFFTAKRLSIITDSDVEWTTDGERGECGREFEIINLHQRMDLLLPDRAAETAPMEMEENTETTIDDQPETEREQQDQLQD